MNLADIQIEFKFNEFRIEIIWKFGALVKLRGVFSAVSEEF